MVVPTATGFGVLRLPSSALPATILDSLLGFAGPFVFPVILFGLGLVGYALLRVLR